MTEEEIGLDRYFAIIWRAKWIIVAGVVVAAAVMAVVAFRQAPRCSASAVIKVGQVWKEPLQDLYVAAEVANNDGFLQAVASKLGADPISLKSRFHAEVLTGGPARATIPLLLRFNA